MLIILSCIKNITHATNLALSSITWLNFNNISLTYFELPFWFVFYFLDWLSGGSKLLLYDCSEICGKFETIEFLLGANSVKVNLSILQSTFSNSIPFCVELLSRIVYAICLPKSCICCLFVENCSSYFNFNI